MMTYLEVAQIALLHFFFYNELPLTDILRRENRSEVSSWRRTVETLETNHPHAN